MTGGPILYVDIDKTLIYPFSCPDKAEAYQGDDAIEINDIKYRVLEKNVYLVERFAASDGVQIVFWSAGGAAWARQVCEALELDHVSEYFLTKPTWYLDDLPQAGIDARDDAWIDAKQHWPED